MFENEVAGQIKDEFVKKLPEATKRLYKDTLFKRRNVTDAAKTTWKQALQQVHPDTSSLLVPTLNAVRAVRNNTATFHDFVFAFLVVRNLANGDSLAVDKGEPAGAFLTVHNDLLQRHRNFITRSWPGLQLQPLPPPAADADIEVNHNETGNDPQGDENDGEEVRNTNADSDSGPENNANSAEAGARSKRRRR